MMETGQLSTFAFAFHRPQWSVLVLDHVFRYPVFHCHFFCRLSGELLDPFQRHHPSWVTCPLYAVEFVVARNKILYFWT